MAKEAIKCEVHRGRQTFQRMKAYLVMRPDTAEHLKVFLRDTSESNILDISIVLRRAKNNPAFNDERGVAIIQNISVLN